MPFHKATILLVVPLASAVLRAAAPVGALTSIGSVRVDGYETRGAATVLDGSILETQTYPAEIDLAHGVRIYLYANSRAQVFARCLLLEQGGIQLRSSPAYSVVSTSVRVLTTSTSAVIRVQDSDDVLRVGVVAGAAEVRRTNGLLMASLNAGRGVSVDHPPDAAAAGPTELTGTLSKQNGRFLLLDDATAKSVEVQGDGLETSVGDCIKLLGSRDPATQIVYVASFKQVSCSLKKGGDVCGAPIAN